MSELAGADHRGIDCDLSCEIPEGVKLVDMPPARHDWSGIIRCPNSGCGRTFLVQNGDSDAL